jgi:hypothetical protein
VCAVAAVDAGSAGGGDGAATDHAQSLVIDSSHGVADSAADTPTAADVRLDATVAPAVLTITGGPDLGTVILGDTGTPVTFTIANTGSGDATNIIVTSNNSAFVLGNDGCTGQTLPKMIGNCTVTLTFSPSDTGLSGAYSGLLTASSTGVNPVGLPITATALKPATLTIAPNPLAFEGIPLNTQSGDKTLTITNTGGVTTGALTLPSGLGNGFAISGNTCSAPLLPAQGCTMAVTYTPESVAWASFSFTVTSASGATATEFLTGTGRQLAPDAAPDAQPTLDAMSTPTPDAGPEAAPSGPCGPGYQMLTYYGGTDSRYCYPDPGYPFLVGGLNPCAGLSPSGGPAAGTWIWDDGYYCHCYNQVAALCCPPLYQVCDMSTTPPADLYCYPQYTAGSATDPGGALLSCPVY